MLWKGFFRYVLIALLLGLAYLSNSVWAVDPAPNPPVNDVALGEGGRLEGQVADTHGNGLANVLVALRMPNHEPVATTTTDHGRFAYQGVSGGVYRLTAGNADYTIRAWAPQTAPPASQVQAVLYVQDDPVNAGPPNDPGAPNTAGLGGAPAGRALGGNLGLGSWATPIIVSAAVATAIALPIALSVHPKPASP